MNKKTLYILIDASGSMRGEKADAVNVAMKDLFENVLEDARQNKEADLEVYVGILTFKNENDIEWIIPKTEIDQIPLKWNPLETQYFYGETPTGAAINAVIEDMDEGNYGERDKEQTSPVILLISDGLPNGDNPTYEEALERKERKNAKFSQNFRYSTRIAIGIDVDDNGRNSLQQFGRLTKSMEGFQSYYDCDMLNKDHLVKIIKAITTGATQGKH